MSNNSIMISYNSNMISNNSNKRYRITAIKDEKLGPEMLRIFYKINFRKKIMPFFIVLWLITSVKFFLISGMYLSGA